MKRFSDVWVLVSLIALFGVMAFLIARSTPQGDEGTPHRTTYSTRPGGLKAAYLLLQKRGVPQVRSDMPPGQWPASARVMITATPWGRGSEGWNEATARKALDWVKAGNTLIVLSDLKTDLCDALNVRPNRGGSGNVPDVEDIVANAAPDVSETVTPRQPLPLFTEVRAVRVPDNAGFKQVPGDAVSLLVGAGTVKPGAKAKAAAVPLLLGLTRGKGQVLVFSTPSVWQNRTLGQDDNARLLVQMVEASLPPGASVAWDEYHQGYGKEQTFWTVVGTPGRLVGYQLIAVSLLAVYAASRRFGLPRPLPAASRVSSEYVASLADLYQRAGATDAALGAVYYRFRRDLCRTLGVSTDADDQQLAKQTAALADPIKRAAIEEALRRLFADCAIWTADQSGLPRREQKRLSEGEMLKLTQQMESLRRDLSIGTK